MMLYDKKYSDGACPKKDWLVVRDKIFSIIEDFLRPRTEDKILEIGCNSGFMQGKFIERGLNVIGVDVNSEALGLNPHDARLMSATDLKFADRSFDKIYSSHTIEHIENLRLSFEEASRVLKSGGVYVAVYPWELFRGMAAMRSSFSLYGNPFLARKFHLHKLNPKKIDDIISGLDILQTEHKLFFANTPQYVSVFKKKS